MPKVTGSIYFFGGTNELLVKQEAQKLADKLVSPKDREFGLEMVNGFANNTDEALTALRRLREALDTLPFFGGSKVVWFKNTNLLAESQTTKSEATTDSLADLAASLKKGLPSGVTLLISATEVDKRRVLFKTIEKIGEVTLIEEPDLEKGGREQITAFITSRLKADGKTIRSNAVDLLIEMIGSSHQAYAHEVEKLAIYTGDRTEITEEDVESIVSASATVDIWKLLGAISARKAADAMNTLDNLLTQKKKENVIGVIALASWNLRQILLCRDLIDQKKLTISSNVWDFKTQWERLPANETAHFPKTKEGKPPSPFGLHRSALAATKFTQKELIAAMTTLLEAQRAIVTTGLNDRSVLEEAILKIIMGGKRESVERQSVGA